MSYTEIVFFKSLLNTHFYTRGFIFTYSYTDGSDYLSFTDSYNDQEEFGILCLAL